MVPHWAACWAAWLVDLRVKLMADLTVKPMAEKLVAWMVWTTVDMMVAQMVDKWDYQKVDLWAGLRVARLVAAMVDQTVPSKAGRLAAGWVEWKVARWG